MTAAQRLLVAALLLGDPTHHVEPMERGDSRAWPLWTHRLCEGDRLASVDWEFGGGDVVAIIMSTPTDEWDRLYPWAAGRQAEILRCIGAEVVAQRARGCVIDFDPREPRWLYVRQAPTTVSS
jgi:hypothetical protein